MTAIERHAVELHMAEGMAAAWGAAWKVEAGNSDGVGPELIHEDGPTLGLSFAEYPQQFVRVWCRWPRGHDGAYTGARYWGVIPYNVKEPSACVSPGRPVARIAADVMRRVVVPYLPLYAAAVIKAAEGCEQRAKVMRASGEIAGVLGEEVGEKGRVIFYGRASIHAEYGPGDIKLRNVPHAVALDIMRLVRAASDAAPVEEGS